MLPFSFIESEYRMVRARSTQQYTPKFIFLLMIWIIKIFSIRVFLYSKNSTASMETQAAFFLKPPSMPEIPCIP